MASGRTRFLTIGAAAGSLGLLAAVMFMLWPPDLTDHAFTSGRYLPDGETVGWVSKVESNTIHVNSGPFGGGVVPLVVTQATRIVVGAKEGWFEDIRPGGQVKVAYELHQGRRFARSVELLVDEGAWRPARTPPLKSAAEAPATGERGPSTGASTPAPVSPPSASEVRSAPQPEPVPVKPESPRPPVSRLPEPARGAEGGETTDGSAAVDWLLQGRR